MKTRSTATLAWGIVAGAPLSAALLLTASSAFGLGDPPSTLPAVPVPVENPMSEEKRVLGKILFWDEQLSTDNTMSCASCHQFTAGGGDPRVLQGPGFDGIINTDDDTFASPGVIRSDEAIAYDPDPFFGLTVQATGRTAPTPVNAAYLTELFWDGRAGDTFVDPETGAVSIAQGGALESQAVGPPLSSVEMGHPEKDWGAITAKITDARPLALATDLPGDVGDALSTNPSYADLFTEAFGDGEVTAERIAFAIATYQRTLISDQSTWDEFRTTDPLAMTPLEQQGWQIFRMRNCNACHIDPLFSGNGFHNIGLRPADEDLGRFDVTGNFFERGAFRTPTLRNVALRPRYMHNGMHETLEEVMRHYGNFDGQQFTENLDPLMNVINLQESDVAPLVAFMGALTDPRVEQGLFPFDAPTLRSQMGPNPALIAGAAPGAMGINPVIIANNPPLLGFDDFRIGLGNVPAGVTATLVVTDTPPSGGTLINTQVVTQVTTDGDLLVNGAGFATAFWPVPSDGALDGEVRYMQWLIDDPDAPSGQSRSDIAQLTLFCGNGDCASACLGDFNNDGTINIFDVVGFITLWNTGTAAADFNGDGTVNIFDVVGFITTWNTGCP